MKLDLVLEVNNLTKKVFPKNFFKDVVSKTLEACETEYSFLKSKKISLSIAVIDSEEMRRLNKAYRKIDSPTDVLSFSEFHDKKNLLVACGKDIFLGEVVLCYNYIEKYSGSSQKAKIETARVLSHGLLHLLGFRHGQKMFRIQDSVALQMK